MSLNVGTPYNGSDFLFVPLVSPPHISFILLCPDKNETYTQIAWLIKRGFPVRGFTGQETTVVPRSIQGLRVLSREPHFRERRGFSGENELGWGENFTVAMVFWLLGLLFCPVRFFFPLQKEHHFLL